MGRPDPECWLYEVARIDLELRPVPRAFAGRPNRNGDPRFPAAALERAFPKVVGGIVVAAIVDGADGNRKIEPGGHVIQVRGAVQLNLVELADVAIPGHRVRGALDHRLGPPIAL